MSDRPEQQRVVSEYLEMLPLSGERLEQAAFYISQDIERIFDMAYAVPGVDTAFQTNSGVLSSSREMSFHLKEGHSKFEKHLLYDSVTSTFYEKLELDGMVNTILRYQKYQQGPKTEEYFISFERTTPFSSELFTKLYEVEFYKGGTIQAYSYSFKQEYEGEEGERGMVKRELSEFDIREISQEFITLQNYIEFHHELKSLNESILSDE